MIQGYHLTEADYRGEQFAAFPGMLKGNNDLLSITRPDIIRDIHRQYLDAGADIFTTNTFNANAISMEDYGMGEYVRDMNLASARLGRELADSYLKAHPGGAGRTDVVRTDVEGIPGFCSAYTYY